MELFITYTILGLCVAGTLSIAASGLVLTYSTTGIFNFAHGAIAMLGAFAFWQLNSDQGWGLPTPVALALVLFVIAPLFGAFLELAIMRRLQGASDAAKVVVSISLLVGCLEIGRILWPEDDNHPVQGFFNGSYVTVFGTTVSWHKMIALLLGIAVAVGLRLVLFNTRIGTSMRAAVDDRGLASLHGARPSNAAMLSWAIGCSLAALAGILFSAEAVLTHLGITLYILNTFAAAVFGRLKSLPLALAGAAIVGLVDGYASGYITPEHTKNMFLLQIRPALPFILLFIVLLAVPSAKLRGHVARATSESIPRPTWGRTLIGCVFFMIFAFQLSQWATVGQALTFSKAFGLALVAASMVPLIGWAGQISLCPLAFAAIGALAMGHHGHGGNWMGLVLAAIFAGIAGVIVALPALRLSGLYLGLATIAFAMILERWIFELPDFEVFGQKVRIFGQSSVIVDPISLPFVDTKQSRTLLMTLAGAFVIFVLFLTAIRRSSYGDRLLALKDSEAAAATLGMNVRRTKLSVFALSAAMAGVGGALYGPALGGANQSKLDVITGLAVALLVVVGGVGSAWGSFFAGFATWIVPTVVAPLTWLKSAMKLLPATLGITIGKSPDGIAGEIRKGFEPLRRFPSIEAAALGGVLVSAALDLFGVIPFWVSVVVSAGIYMAAGSLASSHDPLATATVNPDADLQGAGLDRPFTAADVAICDRALGIEQVRP